MYLRWAIYCPNKPSFRYAKKGSTYIQYVREISLSATFMPLDNTGSIYVRRPLVLHPRSLDAAVSEACAYSVLIMSDRRRSKCSARSAAEHCPLCALEREPRNRYYSPRLYGACAFSKACVKRRFRAQYVKHADMEHIYCHEQ